jgi:preprotein translocase subunit YajC
MSTSLSIPSILAQAAADQAAPGGFLGSQLLFPVLMLIMMFVLMTSGQRKRQKEQDAMLKALKVGDEVVTIGGAHGVVTSIKEKTVMLRIADGVKVEFDRTAVASVVKEPAAA